MIFLSYKPNNVNGGDSIERYITSDKIRLVFSRTVIEPIVDETLILTSFFVIFRAVTDPRDGRRVALKKLPNVFQSLVSSKRVFRELKMLCFFKHDNVSGIISTSASEHDR